jgi:hypothetical protein
MGERQETQEFAMIRKIAFATAVLITASPLAYAAETSSTTSNAPATEMRHPTSEDLKALTDARVGITKAALQLTPEQEKYWPALEEAIRARAKNRQARWERLAELHDGSAVEALRERNAVELMQRRAEMLTQRGADLKKVADAWEPLYKTLSPDQKRRMAFAVFLTGRAIQQTVEHHSDAEDDDE